MQQQSERDLLNRKLDMLVDADIMPEWNKNTAWSILENRLDNKSRKHLRAWYYVSAAAAALLIGLFFYNQNSSPTTSIARQQKMPAIKTPTIPIVTPSVSFKTPTKNAISTEPPAIARKASKTFVPVRPAPALKLHDGIQEEPVAVQQVQPAETLIVTPTKIKRTFSEPVYTLSEILDNVPEREEKPTNYSGIFNLRHSDTKDVQTPENSGRFFPQRSQQQVPFNN